MVTSDMEVEEAEKQDFDVGNNNIKDSESRYPDKVNNQRNGESAVDVCSADMVAVDVTKSENGEEGVLEQRDGAKEELVVQSEIKGLLHDKDEICETKEADGFNGQLIQLISNKLEDKATQIDDQGRAAAENLDQKQNDADNGPIEENSAIDGVEEMTAENVKGCGNLDVSMEEENPNKTAAEKTGEKDEDCIGHVAKEELSTENHVTRDNQAENKELPSKLPSDAGSQYQNGQSYEFSPGEDNGMEDADKVNECNVGKDEPKEQNKLRHATDVIRPNGVSAKHDDKENSSVTKQNVTSTPSSTVRYSTAAGERGSETAKPVHTQITPPMMAGDDNGTPEEQAAFMKEIESFYRQAAIDFKPPKFYGQPLNCLKLWKAVIRLGGYDRVTGSKLWRQVGESFHPPKTCTTVSWTFRNFYEKSLLEFERHKIRSGELRLPVSFPEASGVDIEGNGHQGSGKARRDSAARAMQGRHVQSLFTNGEAGEPVVKDKSLINMEKCEKGVKSMGSLKHKRPDEVDHPVKAARIETPKQLAAPVVDIGPPADWVKINIRQTNDCFEVYCLVPGLLREEVRVQSDPAGRLVITGQPEQGDNPWGITPFKKVVSLPGRIDPLQTSAVVSLHGRLFVRVPFEKPNNI